MIPPRPPGAGETGGLPAGVAAAFSGARRETAPETGRELAHSYSFCARVAREQARNFYYAFLVLPRDKRRAFCAIYAFLRHSDDISDDNISGGPDRAARRAHLETWRERLRAALAGEYGGHPLLPAFHDTVRRFHIPPEYFFELIRGAETDLEPAPPSGARFPTFDDLYRYCYRVAGVVGLVCLNIFGLAARSEAAERRQAAQMAEACGIAFQLTNILRDLKEDAERNRVYLPEDDLARFSYPPGALLAGRPGDAYLRLVRFEAERAREYYRQAAPLIELISADCRPALWAMMELYGSILRRMEARGFPMLRRRVELSDMEKFQVLARAWWMRLNGPGRGAPQVSVLAPAGGAGSKGAGNKGAGNQGG